MLYYKYGGSITWKELINLQQGDITGDGQITDADAIMLSRYLVNDVELIKNQKVAADVTGDGKITNADAVKLARYLAGILTTLD